MTLGIATFLVSVKIRIKINTLNSDITWTVNYSHNKIPQTKGGNP